MYNMGGILGSGDKSEIDNLCDKGLYDEAVRLAKNKKGSKSKSLLKIVKHLCSRGLYDKALQVANDIPANNYKYTSLFEISKSLYIEGMYDKAIQVVNKIPDKNYKTNILSKISKISKCKYDEALKLCEEGLYDKALQVASEIPNKEYKSETLSKLSKCMYDDILKLCGERAYNKAIQLANKIPNKEHKLESLFKIKEKYAAHDASLKFGAGHIEAREPEICISGEILQGLKKPDVCPAFGRECTPEHPLGATMVSSEGACSAYFRYHK